MNKYSKQINMIADYLKPFCKDLLEGEGFSATITDNVYLTVRGGFACDIRISDERPSLRYYNYYNEYTPWSGGTSCDGSRMTHYDDGRHADGFGAFRDMPEWIAAELVLNWKSIKETLLNNREKLLQFREEERRKLEEFEI